MSSVPYRTMRNPKPNTKWGVDERRYMYDRLLGELGVYREWDIGKAEWTERFRRVLCSLSSEMSSFFRKRFTSSQLKCQLRWGLGRMSDRVVGQALVFTFLVNRAAALNSGIINSSELPECLPFNRAGKLREGEAALWR